MTGQDLLDLHRTLGIAHLGDPALAIQNAIAWLCPYLATDDDPWHWWDETLEGEVVCALISCRRLFPEIYTDARQVLAHGAELGRIYEMLLDGINAHLEYHELWELNQMAYGIPLYAFGVDLTDLEDEFPDGPVLLKDLGIDDDTHYQHEIMQVKYQVLQMIQSSLLGPSPTLPDGGDVPSRQAVGWLIAWMFGSTGYSLADISNEALAECGCEDNPWTVESLRLVNEAEEEAARVHAAAQRGQIVLEEGPEWRQALVDNWTRIEELLRHGHTPTRRSCRWPDHPRRVRRGPAPADA